MIDSVLFTNVNGESVILNDDHTPVTHFTTSVESRTTERNKAQQHGMWPANTFLGKRILHFEGDLFGDGSSDYVVRRRLMKRVFTPRPQWSPLKAGTLYMQMTGQPELWRCDCTIDGDPEIPLDALSPERSTYLINLKAFDPRMYGPLRTANVFTPTSGSGRAYSKTFPYTYVGTGSAQDILVTNDGDIETYPIVTMYGPATTPQITLFRSDGRVFTVRVDIVLTTAADSVIVNLRDRTAFTNTGQNVYNFTKGSSWWALEPGSGNTVRYTATSYDPASYAKFQWSNAYML